MQGFLGWGQWIYNRFGVCCRIADFRGLRGFGFRIADFHGLRGLRGEEFVHCVSLLRMGVLTDWVVWFRTCGFFGISRVGFRIADFRGLRGEITYETSNPK